MKAKYLGLDLSSPIVVSSSPYTASIGNVEQCVRNGAGAVVLKSIFEEQIYRQAASLDRMEGYGDAGEYLERYLGEAYKAELLELVSDAAKTGIPVIGSINCAGAGDAWIEYAAAMQQAGASALELNIFLLPTDRRASAQEIESHYAGIVRKVVAEVTIPVSVKLPMRLTNVLSVGDALLGRGAGGLVLYNRFFEPDIDIEKMCLVNGDPFSEPAELRNVLRSPPGFRVARRIPRTHGLRLLGGRFLPARAVHEVFPARYRVDSASFRTQIPDAGKRRPGFFCGPVRRRTCP